MKQNKILCPPPGFQNDVMILNCVSHSSHVGRPLLVSVMSLPLFVPATGIFNQAESLSVEPDAASEFSSTQCPEQPPPASRSEVTYKGI